MTANKTEEDFELQWERDSKAFQPWQESSPSDRDEQSAIQSVLRRRCSAQFGDGCYVAPGAKVFTNSLMLGDRSFVASGSILRGSIKIGANCSVNPYCHLAGAIEIGSGVRIAGHVSIYGFNHGYSRTDMPIKDQPHTSKGVVVGDDVWIGCNAAILDGVKIGSHSIVAAGAVVTKSFPEYSMIGGNPAKLIGDRRDRDTRPAGSIGRSSQKVSNLLYASDPYQDLHWTMPTDFQGWGSTDPVFKECILGVKPSLIVEVGTWKGASALHMADLCKANSVTAEIVCVDTWLGNWQHWSRESGVGSKEDLRLINGFPTLYFQFLSNVVSKGYQNTITPLPLTGVAAAKLFAHYNLRPELIYIDGDHEYEGVLADLNSWLPLLADDGILIGDDYSFPGVRRAVTEIAAVGQWKPIIRENKFTLSRSSQS